MGNRDWVIGAQSLNFFTSKFKYSSFSTKQYLKCIQSCSTAKNRYDLSRKLGMWNVEWGVGSK